MAGIVSFGAYIPYYRLGKGEISKAWGGGAIPGEKAVASFDQDAITMGVEAARDCLTGINNQIVDGVLFASSSSPYKEKQSAAIVADYLGLPSGIPTMDISNSLRAGTSAVRLAVDMVKAGSQKNVLVVASDCRVAFPQSALEQTIGDGAAALLIGDKGVAADVKGIYSVSDQFMDYWKTEGSPFIQSWEDRFIFTQGYQRILPQAVAGVMSKCKLEPADIAKAAYYAPDARNHGGMVKTLGLKPAQVQDHLLNVVGNTGTAMPLMILVSALEEAQAGQKLLMVGYGDGADAIIMQTTEKIEKMGKASGVKGYLAVKGQLPYHTYLRFRKLLAVEPAMLPPPYSSLPSVYRDRESLFELAGSKCNHCGEIQIPIDRVCPKCHTKDDHEKVSFADKKATLATYAMDYVLAVPNPPYIDAQIVFDGGGRITTGLVEADLDAVEVGMAVEMTPRLIRELDGIRYYYWRSRPVRR